MLLLTLELTAWQRRSRKHDELETSAKVSIQTTALHEGLIEESIPLSSRLSVCLRVNIDRRPS